MDLGLETLLFNAVEMADVEARDAYLRQVCGSDDAKLAELQSMVRDYFAAGYYLDRAATVPPTLAADGNHHLGLQIGPYKLLEQIGQGGMGSVYMAQQKEPVRRVVALKLIKPGMDSRQVLARFDAERQALAMMDHPSIARIIDAGMTDLGRPYFVMELVRGVPINEFCDSKRLTLQERLQLFIQVCQAVQHAHQKGIIHRDLKPSNVLVTMLDVQAVPKVIDFGIAKAFGPQLAELTQVTGFAQCLGTPQYMSPEQAEMNQFGVDTRSDVYSLGVMLYELLTGTTPIDKELLKKTSFEELRRMLREQEPPRPSARISTLDAQALSTIAERRCVDPHRIATSVRGELDWIVLKALEKDRERRYESVNALAADVGRYLKNENVHACPPSMVYRFQKYARRHRAQLVTLTAIASILMGATIVSSSLAAWAVSEQRLAQQNETIANREKREARSEAERADQAAALAELQKQVAQENFLRAREAVDTFLTDVSENQLLNAPSLQSLRKDLLQLALNYYKEFTEERGDDPELQAELAAAYYRIGNVEHQLGNMSQAQIAHEKSLKLRERLVTANPQDQESQHALAESHIEMSYFANTNAEIIAHVEHAIELTRPLLKEKHQITFGKATVNFAELSGLFFKDRGGTERMSASREALEQAVIVLKRHPENPKAQLQLSAVYSQLAFWHGTMGDSELSKEYHRRAIEISGELIAKEPNNFEYQKWHYASLWNIGEYDKSLAGFERRRDQNPLVMEFHQEVAMAYSKLGGIRQDPESYRRSIEAYGKLAEDFSKDYPDHKFTALAGVEYSKLGKALSSQGKTEEAIAAYNSAISILEDLDFWLGHLHDSYQGLSAAYDKAQRLDEAILAHKTSLDVVRKLLEIAPEQLHYRRIASANTYALGGLLHRNGQFDEAVKTRQDAVELLREAFANGTLPDGTPAQVQDACNTLIQLQQDLMKFLVDLDRHIEAAECWRGLIDDIANLSLLQPEKHSHYLVLKLQAHIELAQMLEQTNRPQESTEQYEHALTTLHQIAESSQALPEAVVVCQKLIMTTSSGENGATPAKTRIAEFATESLTKALELSREAVREKSGTSKLWDTWNSIALAHYRRQNWQGAEVEAELAVQLATDNPDLMLRIVPLYLLAGKHDKYRSVCEQLMDRWQEWTGNDLGCAAAMCVLDPNPPPEPERLMRLVQRAVEEGPDWSITHLNFAYSRTGNYQRAIEAFQAASNSLRLAIALYHAGNGEDARACLTQVLDDWDEKTPQYTNSRMEREVLRQEAERLILGTNDPVDLKPDSDHEI